MATLPDSVKTQIKDGLAASMEQVIRDAAGTVIGQIQSRHAHPTYGYTKTKIRNQYERMEGQIGLYMVLMGQATHAGIPLLAEFADETTKVVVENARRNVEAL